jgi:catechol 2,3-dioxygenase-like lactoylglutathione lyase family enzyme
MGCEQSAFGHVGIIVPDMKKAADFYQTYFGFPVEKRIENKEKGLELLFLDAGNGSVELICRAGESNAVVEGAIDHIAFICADLVQGMKVLQARGIAAADFVVKDSPSGGKHTFFPGPFGEKLQLLAGDMSAYEGDFALEHIGIRVKSLDETLKYYQRGLGFDIVLSRTHLQRKPRIIFLRAGAGAMIELVENDRDAGSNPVEHFALKVGNIPYWLEQMERFIALPNKEPNLTASGTSMNIKVKAPDGEVVELIQPV